MNSGYYFLSHSTTKWWYFKVKTQRKERRKQARKRIMGDIMEREDGRNPEQGQQVTKEKRPVPCSGHHPCGVDSKCQDVCEGTNWLLCCVMANVKCVHTVSWPKQAPKAPLRRGSQNLGSRLHSHNPPPLFNLENFPLPQNKIVYASMWIHILMLESRASTSFLNNSQYGRKWYILYLLKPGPRDWENGC